MTRVGVEAIWAARAILAHARAQWLETSRFKALWVYEAGWAFLFFVPLALTGMAFGDAGFEASGGGQSFLAFAVTGFVALNVATAALWRGVVFLEKSNQTGTLAHLWAAEAPRWTALTGATVVDVGFAALRGLLILVIASLLFKGAAFAVTLPTVLALLIALVAFWGLGLALAGVGLVARQARFPEILGALAMVMAGGTYPIAILPWSVRWISYVNPYTYVVDLVRSTTIGTPPLLAIEFEFLIVGAIAIACVFGGSRIFFTCERIAIQRGLVGLHA